MKTYGGMAAGLTYGLLSIVWVYAISRRTVTVADVVIFVSVSLVVIPIISAIWK